MANLDKSEMADRILEHIGVKAGGDSAAGKDSTFVQEAIDAAHERLTLLGLAPFATSAIPPWAQIQIRDYVAADVCQAFGLSHRLAEFEAKAQKAEFDLARQIARARPPMSVRYDNF